MQSDLISRSKLHKSLLREETIVVDGLQYIRADVVKEKLSMAPSVKVERGRWKYSSSLRNYTCTCSGYITCSKCKSVFERMVGMPFYKYCPHCGKPMDAKEKGHEDRESVD